MNKTRLARQGRMRRHRKLAARHLCLFCLAVFIVGSALLSFSSLGLATDTISPPTDREVEQWLEERKERYISQGEMYGTPRSFKVIETVKVHRLNHLISEETVRKYGTSDADWWIFVIFQDGNRTAVLTVGRWGWQGELPLSDPMFTTYRAREIQDEYESPGSTLPDGSECKSLEQAISALKTIVDDRIKQEGLEPGWPVVTLGSKPDPPGPGDDTPDEGGVPGGTFDDGGESQPPEGGSKIPGPGSWWEWLMGTVVAGAIAAGAGLVSTIFGGAGLTPPPSAVHPGHGTAAAAAGLTITPPGGSGPHPPVIAGFLPQWVLDRAGDAGSWVKEKAQDAGGWAKERAGDAGSWIMDKAGDAGSWVREKAQDAGGWAVERIDGYFDSKRGHYEEGHEIYDLGERSPVQVVDFYGEVGVWRDPEGGDWRIAELGDPLKYGETIETGRDSYVEIHDGIRTIRLGPNDSKFISKPKTPGNLDRIAEVFWHNIKAEQTQAEPRPYVPSRAHLPEWRRENYGVWENLTPERAREIGRALEYQEELDRIKANRTWYEELSRSDLARDLRNAENDIRRRLGMSPRPGIPRDPPRINIRGFRHRYQ